MTWEAQKAVCTTVLFMGLLMVMFGLVSIWSHWDWYNWSVPQVTEIILGAIVSVIAIAIVWENA